MNQPKPSGVAIPTRWESPEQAPTIYANQLVVTHVGGESYLVFGEIIPPLILGPDKEPLPEFVPVKPRVKIVVTPEHMIIFTKAIQQNVENFLKDQSTPLREQ